MGNKFCSSEMGNCFKRHKKIGNSDHDKLVNVPRSPRHSGLMGVTERSTSSSHPLPTPTAAVQACGENETKTLPTPKMVTELSEYGNLKAFCFSELEAATRNFSRDILLGEGGFGFVYKGWLNKENLTASTPASGMAVAVKRLKPQGFQGHKEWLSEVIFLGQLHHPNLVKLIGYCLEGENRLLVYEYLPKGSLENHLFRRSKPLPWATRLKVAIGAARGLCFLHSSESQVIYRDFKSSNVLLESDFSAKLSDFGLARAGPFGDRTHVTTEVMGTEGYTAPEYVSTGHLTAKCDIYSFGIVLLELLTGRRALDESRAPGKKLVDWVKPQVDDKGKIYRIMDSRLEGQYPRKAAYFAANLGLQCAHIEPRARPVMSDVLAILEKLSLPKFTEMNASPDTKKMPILPPTNTQPSPLGGSQQGEELH